MASTTIEQSRLEPTHFRNVQWQKAALAGLMVGAIMFFARAGIPWVASGAINPNVMGFEPAPGAPGTPTYFLGMLALHLGVAAVYGLIIGAIAHPLRPFLAAAAGATAGLVLYFITFAIFRAAVPDVPQREVAAGLHHLAFGVIAAAFYKGMVRRRAPIPLM